MLGCGNTWTRALPRHRTATGRPTADAVGPGRDASPSADGAAPGDTREVVPSDAPPDEVTPETQKPLLSQGFRSARRGNRTPMV